MTSLNPRLAKLHRSYTTEEVARLYDVHRNTVRAWCKSGLPTIDGCRPTLIQGRDLRTFLQRRRDQAKRPCPPGSLYCCKCRTPRPAMAGTVAYQVQAGKTGTLRALCGTCGTQMFRRARRAALAAVMPDLAVRIVEGEGHIEECPHPSLNCT